MMGRKPPSTTMGASANTVTPDAPEKSEEKESRKEEPKAKVSKVFKEAADALCKVLNGPGVDDPKKEYGSAFDAFHKAAKSDGPEGGDYQGLTVDMMDEDVNDSVKYAKRIKSRRYWGAKLSAL